MCIGRFKQLLKRKKLIKLKKTIARRYIKFITEIKCRVLRKQHTGLSRISEIENFSNWNVIFKGY